MQPNAARELSSTDTNKALVIPFVLLCLGFLLRVFQAHYRFLNADEALHYLLSLQPSLSATYRATLTTAHPPLLIVLLHYWGMLGHSEFFLRIPSLIAGSAFCWVMFCWLRLVTDHITALFSLTLLLFSPALILLSAEVRQYALLLLFCAASLYFLDRAVIRNCPLAMLFSMAGLYLALLTHYSSFLFALTLGLYAVVRFFSARVSLATIIVWVAGQLGALALIAFMFVHHISKQRSLGASEGILGTYLRRSVFDPHQDHVILFVARNSLRLLHYIFSQGAAGAIGLILFVGGLIVLLCNDRRSHGNRLPTSRQLAFLLVFPMALTCALALFRIYPYGGTRHNSLLSLFVIPGIALALSHGKPDWLKWKAAGLAVALLICNAFPVPQGEYIRLGDQNRKLMREAVAALNSLPADSTIFTDDQGGLLLSYYLCDAKVVQIEQSPFQPFMRSRCGQHWVISLDPAEWSFKPDTFPQTLKSVQHAYNFAPGTPLWVFQSGWFIDREFSLRDELRQFGGLEPRNFGRNIFLCRITL